MTGCYPKRIEMATGSNFGVLLAGDTKGLNPDEVTIAEILKGVTSGQLSSARRVRRMRPSSITKATH